MSRQIHLILLLLLIPLKTLSSDITSDSMTAGTIAGQSTSNGMTFSSFVYISAGSSVTLQGSGGYITNSSSITASALFGSGAQINGAGVLFATQTHSGANEFVSSVTIQSGGRAVIFSTSATTNNISLNAQGAISFYPELHNSSATTVPDITVTNNTFGPCIAGSTITITSTGGRIELNFTGSFYGGAGGGGSRCGLNVLQDGDFISGLSSTVGITSIGFDSGTSYAAATPFSYLITAPSAGTHSYCLAIARLSGGSDCTLVNSLGRPPLGSGSARNQFYVKEIK